MPKSDELSFFLKEKFDTDVLEIEDISGGCGSQFKLFIVSKLFEGKSLLDRHRLVYEVLGDLMKHEIHSLSFKKCWTPEEYMKNSQKDKL